MLDESTKVIRGISRTIDDKEIETYIDARYWGKYEISDIKTIDGQSIFKKGEGDISNIAINRFATEVTYNELKKSLENNELTPGLQYRITDYVTKIMTVDDMPNMPKNARSAEHPFDIIVTATSTNTLSEVAKAVLTNRNEVRYRKFDFSDVNNWETNDSHPVPKQISDSSISKLISHQFATKDYEANDYIKVDFVGVDNKGNQIKGLGAALYKYQNDTYTLIDVDYGIKSSYYVRVPEDGSYMLFFYAEGNVKDLVDGVCGVTVDVCYTPYFIDSKLDSWKIWYCFDNDTNRFAWADDSINLDTNLPNGRGVIYRMIDEFGNECQYDFKNIQFKRDKEWLKNNKSKFSKLKSLDLENIKENEIWFYTFSNVNGGATVTVSDDTLNGGECACKDNTIGVYRKKNGCHLNNTIFIGNGASSNHIDEGNYDNTFGYNVSNNIINLEFYNNVVADNFSYNRIGINCNNNIINGVFQNNKVGNEFQENKIYETFSYNVIGNRFRKNSLYGAFNFNEVKNEVYSNEFDEIIHTNINDYFYSNNSHSNDKNNKKIIKYCKFGNGIQWISDLPSMTNVIFDNEVVRHNTQDLGLKDIVLSTGETAISVLGNMIDNTSKVLFTKQDEIYYVVNIADNEKKLEAIYDLGSFSNNKDGENAAYDINIIRNPKILFIKFHNEEKDVDVYIQQMVVDRNCGVGSYGYAKQCIYLDGNIKIRKCWFTNVLGVYQKFTDTNHNSDWVTVEDSDGILYSDGEKVLTSNDLTNYVTLDGEQQIIEGSKQFDKDINLAGKTIIKNGENIDNGELKIFKVKNIDSEPEVGFTIRTNGIFEDSDNIPKLELLATNNVQSYTYKFPKLNNSNDVADIVIIDQLNSEISNAKEEINETINNSISDTITVINKTKTEISKETKTITDGIKTELNEIITYVQENEKVTSAALNHLNDKINEILLILKNNSIY